MQIPNTFESVLLAELNLELPPLSFYKLGGEADDWSFVLKLHAIMECALNRLLESRLSEDEFEQAGTFARRVQLAFEIPEFANDAHYRSFLITLNYLRNRFAHNARYIVADLKTVLQEIPSHKRNATLQSLAVGLIIPGTAENDPRNYAARQKYILGWPRFTILNSAAYALEMLSLAYYVHLGKDGRFYSDEFRPQLQDLLHDPKVLEFRREIESELPGDDSSSSNQ